MYFSPHFGFLVYIVAFSYIMGNVLECATDLLPTTHFWYQFADGESVVRSSFGILRVDGEGSHISGSPRI